MKLSVNSSAVDLASSAMSLQRGLLQRLLHMFKIGWLECQLDFVFFVLGVCVPSRQLVGWTFANRRGFARGICTLALQRMVSYISRAASEHVSDRPWLELVISRPVHQASLTLLGPHLH